MTTRKTHCNRRRTARRSNENRRRLGGTGSAGAAKTKRSRFQHTKEIPHISLPAAATIAPDAFISSTNAYYDIFEQKHNVLIKTMDNTSPNFENVLEFTQKKLSEAKKILKENPHNTNLSVYINKLHAIIHLFG